MVAFTSRNSFFKTKKFLKFLESIELNSSIGLSPHIFIKYFIEFTIEEY